MIHPPVEGRVKDRRLSSAITLKMPERLNLLCRRRKGEKIPILVALEDHTLADSRSTPELRAVMGILIAKERRPIGGVNHRDGGAAPNDDDAR
jgi:hypothetical protein